MRRSPAGAASVWLGSTGPRRDDKYKCIWVPTSYWTSQSRRQIATHRSSRWFYPKTETPPASDLPSTEAPPAQGSTRQRPSTLLRKLRPRRGPPASDLLPFYGSSARAGVHPPATFYPSTEAPPAQGSTRQRPSTLLRKLRPRRGPPARPRLSHRSACPTVPPLPPLRGRRCSSSPAGQPPTAASS